MKNESQKLEQLMSGWKIALVVGVGLLLVSNGALAQSADGSELADGICKVVNVLTGKWLFGFTMLATIGSGAALLFGAEITDGLKKMATIITVVGIIIAMSSLLSMAFTKFSGTTC